MSEMTVQKYVRSPESYFSSPLEVLKHSDLSRREMYVVLSSWKNDLMEMQFANEENMPCESPQSDRVRSADKLGQVIDAMQTLEDESKT